jgi:WD40 repeat protein
MRTFGNYVLLAELGRGGGSVVWEARHLAVDRACAVKVLHRDPDSKPSERRLARFLFEAEVLARLDHPSVVRVHGAGEVDGERFIELELVEGGSLAEWLSSQRPEPGQIPRWILQLAEALAHAHGRGVLHRDLKPGNVLITAEDNLKLGDFGLAREFDFTAPWTRTLGAVGTPAFMAPEVAREGMAAFTPRADIYGLGAVLYQMLTGAPPHVGADALEVLDHVRNRMPRRPREVNPNVSPDLEIICLRCMDPDPARRFASAQDVVDELRRHLSGTGIRSRADGPLRQCISWSRRHRALAASLGGLAALFLLGFALVSWQWLRADRLARSLTVNLSLARLHAAQRDLETGNGPRALAELAAAARTDAPEVEARRLLEFWLHQGAFVPPPVRMWSHEHPVVRALYSRDGRRILVQLADGDAVVYPAGSTNVLLHLNGVDLGRASVPGFDGTSLLARQTNGALVHWSIPDPGVAPSVDWQIPRVQQWVVSAPPNHWAAVDSDGGIWTGMIRSTGEPLRVAQLPGATGWVAMAMSPTGTRMMGGSRQPGWDVVEAPPPNANPDRTWQVRRLTGHIPELQGLVVSPRGSRLLAFGGQKAEVWDLDSGIRTTQLEERRSWVSGRFDSRGTRFLLSDTEGNVVVAGSQSGRITERDRGLRSGRLLLQGEERVSDVRGALLTYPAITIGAEGTLRFHPKTNQHYVAIASVEAPVTSIAMNPDQTLVLSASEDGMVKEWQRPVDRWTPDFLNLGPSLRFLNPWGSDHGIVGSDGEGAFVWESLPDPNGLRRLPLDPSVQPVAGPTLGSHLAIAADGRHWVSIEDGTGQTSVLHALPEPAVRLTRSASGHCFAALGLNQIWFTEHRQNGWSPIRSVASPGVRQCVLTGVDDRPWILDAEGQVHVIDLHAIPRVLPAPFAVGIRQLDSSGDGKHLLLTGRDGEVQAWHADPSLTPVRSLRLNPAVSQVVPFPSDGRVAIALLREVRIWDSSSPSDPLRIGGFDHPIASVAVSPSGEMIAVSTLVEQLQLFSTRTGQPLTPVWALQERRRPATPYSLMFTADDLHLIGWNPSGRIFHLPLPRRMEPMPGRSDPLLDLADYLAGHRSSRDGRWYRIPDPERKALHDRLTQARQEGRWDPGWERYWVGWVSPDAR